MANLLLNAKCHFGSREIHILRHLSDKRIIQPDPGKVSSVTGIPTLVSLKDIQSFLRFSDILELLRGLLWKDQTSLWGKDKQAFPHLKQGLTSASVLAHFFQELPTETHMDVSSYGIGAELVRKQGSAEHVVWYATLRLTQAEQNWSTTESECLAMVWAVYKFQPHLFGYFFTGGRDRHSSGWLFTMKDLSCRLARGSLQQCDITTV